jgi:hypothetical protein
MSLLTSYVKSSFDVFVNAKGFPQNMTGLPKNKMP